MPPAPKEELEEVFPALVGTPWEIASPQDPSYNCVAFALGDTSRWWWPFALPASSTHWPPDVPRAETLEGFCAALEGMGFVPADGDALVAGVSKVALFAKGSRPSHIAVQRGDGRWASKLGTQWDIVHPLTALEGDEYGLVTNIYARPTR